jgi:uncharacterized protein
LGSTQAAIELLKAWSTVKAVDHHCHPLWRWPRATTVMDLRAMFTEALDPRIAADHVPATVAYRDALRRIAGELGCTATEEVILQARDREDPAAYTNELLRRSGTGVMLLDHGFASAEAFTPAEHVQAIGIPQREVVRLEVLAEQVIGQAETSDEWFVVVRSRLREAAKAGAVGVKTIAAYRAGLRLRPATVGQVEADFTRLHAMVEDGETVRLTGAPLVHNLLFEAAEECRDLGLPLQVHCGFGDPDEDLAEGSPLGLRPLLADPLYEGLQIALLHCYPYHREAAYLCSAYPGVFMDLSLTLPLAGLDGARAMREVLGLCPWTKLLYASDASRLPEYFLVAAAVHREALASALAEVVETGILTHDEAVAAGSQVLASNARLLYHL